MNIEDLRDRALALHRSGRLEDAEKLYRELLTLAPRDFTARHLLGVIHAQQGRNDQALDEITAALAIRPDDADALLNRANVRKALDQAQAALADYDRALATRPGWPQALNNRGTVLQQLGRFEEALASYDAALAAGPHAEALNNRGSVLQDLKRPAEALAAYDQALRLAPNFAIAFNNRGSVLLELNRPGDALACFERALALKPGDAKALNNRGNALQALLRHEEAVAAYDQALALKPDYPEALNNRGSALQELKRHDEALDSYDRAGLPEAFGGAAMAALNLCDWDRAAKFGAQMQSRIKAGDPIPPWVLLGYGDDPALQMQCARNVIARRFAVTPPPLASAPYAHDRIRLAYVSSDFGYHPVTAQIVQLIEQHDRSGFEIIGIATSADDGSPQRRRIAAAFDRFHDLHSLGAWDTARFIRALEVDILVDLNGHTKGDNFDILSHRPAPVQVTWLGYAGTSAAPFVDHVIADGIVAADPAFFSETLALMPHCFFPTDSGRVLGQAPTRAEAGLPQDGFVFCCFNNNWKITAPVFAIWMRLLQQAPGSVLWLKAGDAAAANLRRAAQRAGVDPARLVFAKPAPLDVHLARHQLAGLFLDTWPYNAHATACDALWSGLPVLTQMGKAYAGRVAASLLRSLGLPDLVTQTPADYEAMALALARDPARLAGLRTRLAAARFTAPLFDTQRFARDLEALLTTLLPPSQDAAMLFRQAAALQHLNRAAEALARYDQAIALRPGFAAALNNRGNVLRGLDRHDEALASFDAALAADPAQALARYNRGETLLALDRPREAFDDFAQAAKVFHADAVHDRLKPHKIAHDGEQKAWLAQQGIAVSDAALHLEGGSRLDGPALAALDAPAITRQWRQATPQLVVVDGLLTPQALAALRRFCLGSTVWRKAHEGDYLGAFPENGFAAPLLAQIAEELRAALPAIFRDHPLLYAWAFKYDSALRGTEIHADEAAVNVNFWITPDDANRDPAHGGLVVWDKAAPLDWDFAKFNNDVQLARDFLARSGAQPHTVPYRCNRAVIFDSDLFHETDRIDFAPGYENRRINVTLLYGRRK